MIHIQSIRLSYGSRQLLREVSAQVRAGDRIGLVGPNGAGKSTLLRILTGRIEPDSGQVEFAQNSTLGILEQELPNYAGRSLYDEVAAVFVRIREIEARVGEATQRLQHMDHESAEYRDLLGELGSWEHELEMLEASKVDARIRRVLHGLGFTDADTTKDCATFSGGWQMRIALAKLLLESPSLLLLDEPTNHLDLESLHWLEQFLAQYQGAVILVSHDQAFLDAMTNKTFALSQGKLEVYAGNYSFFVTESAERKAQLLRAAASQERQIKETERFIERFRAKASKASQVQSRIKALEKVERIELETEDSEIAFRFPEPKRSGQVVLQLEGIHKSYGQNHVLQGIDLVIERGSRMAVVGANGAGKSTLVKVLAGMEAYQHGERKVGHNVELSYFAQHQAEELDPAKTVLEEAQSVAPPGQGQRARNLLGSFLFRGDDQHKKVAVLSGGEKNRLALAKMLLQPFNCLILDEPTNHLDMRSKSILQQALMAYQGAFIIVSHDRAFLDPIVEQVLEVKNHSARIHEGTVSEFVSRMDAQQTAVADNAARDAAKAKAAANAAAPSSADNELSAKERRQLVAARNEKLRPLRKQREALEAKIAQREVRIVAMEQEMINPDFFKRGDATRVDLQAFDQLKREVEIAYHEWAEIEQQIEALQ